MFKYQAVLRDASGNIIANQSKTVVIDILQTSPSGTSIFTESHNVTTTTQGIININIGSVNSLSGIDWTADEYFIQITVDGTIMGTSQLLSVPYALHAKTAESLINTGHYVGELYGGGVIFHLWKDNAGVEHGLIVALTDQSTSQKWSNVTDIQIGTSAQSSWDGLSNSNAIVGQTGHTSSAAKLCLDLVSGGQSDWYLPSIQELNMLWNNYCTVARSLSQIGGATQIENNYYWSSSEDYNFTAWGFSFYGGYPTTNDKNNTSYVRAVRAF